MVVDDRPHVDRGGTHAPEQCSSLAAPVTPNCHLHVHKNVDRQTYTFMARCVFERTRAVVLACVELMMLFDYVSMAHAQQVAVLSSALSLSMLVFTFAYSWWTCCSFMISLGGVMKATSGRCEETN